MTPTIKFGLGDKVWIVENSRAIQVEVNSIYISNHGTSYWFAKDGETNSLSIEEEKCFATKDELLKYVAGE